jgi:cytosine/adenosine deaminase-related metal-dependent hydrolase
MRPQGTASVLFALVSVVSAVAQTPSALDEAMPQLRGVSRVALRHVRIVDGTGAPARQNQTLIIENGRIGAVGGGAEIAIPEGTHTLDLDGRTVLPGFVMLHEHMVHGSENGDTHPEPFTSPRLFLAVSRQFEQPERLIHTSS